MGIPWRSLAHVALAVVGVMAPQVVVAERAVEDLVRAKGAAKKDAAVAAGLEILKGYETVMSSSLRTHPQVTAALADLNDVLVKLRDALETAAAESPGPAS
jgi:hypothetical protein